MKEGWQSAVMDLGEGPMAIIAAQLAPLLAAGDILCLEGDLGAGKSSFARYLLRARLGDEGLDVPSPTFTLVQIYEDGAGTEIWHGDLYRLEEASELDELGFDDVQNSAIFLIEWPQLLPSALQEQALWLSFGLSGQDDRRTIRFSGHPDWQRRLAALLGDLA